MILLLFTPGYCVFLLYSISQPPLQVVTELGLAL